MRSICLVKLFLVSAITAGAQSVSVFPYKTVEYIAPDGHVLPSPEGADHRIERTYRDSLSGVERIYSTQGNLRMSTPYASMAYRIKLGPETTFYEGGQLHTKEDFVGNKRNGEFLVYYPDGRLKRRETYSVDVRKTGDCFAQDGSSSVFYEYEVMPTYRGGGTDKMTQAIAANVHYPVEALRNQVQGRVFVSFRVGVSGAVEEVKVVKGVSAELDQAAVAAVKKLTGFTPGRQDGEPVSVSFTMPVTFTISQAPPTFRSTEQHSGNPNPGNPY